MLQDIQGTEESQDEHDSQPECGTDDEFVEVATKAEEADDFDEMDCPHETEETDDFSAKLEGANDFDEMVFL